MSTFASSLLSTELAYTSSTRNRDLFSNSTTIILSKIVHCFVGSVFPTSTSRWQRLQKELSPNPSDSKSEISCSLAQPETLQVVQEIIAKQLSLEQSTVFPQTKFSELGADSLDTVEIMMALEEKSKVLIPEGGAEGISTVQDATDLIEKVKASSAS